MEVEIVVREWFRMQESNFYSKEMSSWFTKKIMIVQGNKWGTLKFVEIFHLIVMITGKLTCRVLLRIDLLLR